MMTSSNGSFLRVTGGCFTNVSRALQNILPKFVCCRNRTSYEHFKLKLCSCAQSHALGMRTKFQLEILTINMITGIVYFHRRIPLTKANDAGFDVFFDLHLNKWLNKPSRCWWFETPWCSLWRHRNAKSYYKDQYAVIFLSGANNPHMRYVYWQTALMETIPINLGGRRQLFSEVKATEYSSRIMFSHSCLANNNRGRIESLKYRILLYFPHCHNITLLQWRHNERDGVSNHQPHDYLLNRLFRRRSKKTSKLRVTGLCEGNSPVTRWIPRTKGQ